MTAPKKPQDHKKKSTRPKTQAVAAEAGGRNPFEFEHDGKTYTLPNDQEAASRVPGQLVRDAIMSGDDATEMKLAFATLEAADPDPEALEALYAKPFIEMFTILGEWMQAINGVSAGKS